MATAHENNAYLHGGSSETERVIEVAGFHRIRNGFCDQPEARQQQRTATHKHTHAAHRKRETASIVTARTQIKTANITLHAQVFSGTLAERSQVRVHASGDSGLW